MKKGIPTKVALAKALLAGEVLNCANIHRMVGYSNISREIIRSAEESFDIEVHRERKEGKSRYGCYRWWLNYELKHTERNKKGILEMKKYIASWS